MATLARRYTIAILPSFYMFYPAAPRVCDVGQVFNGGWNRQQHLQGLPWAHSRISVRTKVLFMDLLRVLVSLGGWVV